MRNINVEILRIICFIMVIANHIISPGYVYNGEMVDIVCLWNIFNIVAVPCFLMITGYFLFDDKRYIDKVKKMFKGVILPFAISIILYIIFFPWVAKEKGFFECFYLNKENFLNAWEHLRNWDTSFSGCWHLWYIFAYIKVFLWYPVLRIICKEGNLERVARQWMIIICLGSLFMSNFQILAPTLRLPSLYSFVDVNVMYIIVGYEFKNITQRRPGKICLYGLGLFLVSSLMGYFGTRRLFAIHGEFQYTFYYSGSLFMALASIGFFVFVMSLKITMPNKVGQIICKIGKNTFYAYLIQYFFIWPIRDFFRSCVRNAMVQYMFTIVGTVIITLILSSLLNQIREFCCRRGANIK